MVYNIFELKFRDSNDHQPSFIVVFSTYNDKSIHDFTHHCGQTQNDDLS